MALAYGGIAQFAAGLWEFAKGNTFGATAFCSYGAFWVSSGGSRPTTCHRAAGSDAHKAIGLYLLAWGIFTAYMSVAAIRVNVAVLAVFVLLTITFLVLAWGDFATSTGIRKLRRLPRSAHGDRRALRLVRRGHAFTWGRAVVPVGPRGSSRAPVFCAVGTNTDPTRQT